MTVPDKGSGRKEGLDRRHYALCTQYGSVGVFTLTGGRRRHRARQLHVHPDIEQWEEVVAHRYPRMGERSYFILVANFNRVHYDTQSICGQNVPETQQVNVLVPQPTLEERQAGDQFVSSSDVRDDKTTQHVLGCLKALADQRKEVMFVLSQLDFGDYLGEPCYSAVPSLLPRLVDLQTTARDSPDKGDFDILIIHREYGLLVGEVKSVGDHFSDLKKARKEEDDIVEKKVKQAIKQLDKAEQVLTHLVSDLQTPPRVGTTLIVPNMPRSQLQRVLHDNRQLKEVPWLLLVFIN